VTGHKLTPARGMPGQRLPLSPFAIHGCRPNKLGRDEAGGTHNHPGEART
jgi:hypothetical protein